ncbi:unnamed protein product [Cuscuta campestris]|uniref:RNase H type-1 domain-containing protein n=1 Tax=Cuscuta campestris TaxID=132261 RepID=A0A484K0K5_9ASTE|nr:unnamed protein product [Cuscuta campestris]
MGKNRSKRNKIAAKARTNLEGKEKLSSEDLRHQITLSQSRRETQDKSGERSFHSKAPKSSHPKDSQAAAEKFDANSPIVRKLIGWLNKEGEARSQGTGRETGQGEDEEVESQGRISVHKRMRKNASQRLGPRTEESGENSGGHDNEDAEDILKLRKEMEELKRQVDKDGSFGPTVEIISPLTARVMKAQLPGGMKAPEIRYKGVTDPNDHLAAYQTHMLMHAVEDEIQCRLFVGTLEGPAVKWFLTLPNGTIDCFKDLAQLFLNAYGGRFQPKKHFTHLFSLKQKEGETNSELVQRWNEAINEVEPMDDKTSIALFMNVLSEFGPLEGRRRSPKASLLHEQGLKRTGKRYTPLEKCVLAVVVTVKRLTPYFQAHPVRIMTDQPLGAVLRDPSSSGKVIKWAMVLSQYDISYQPRSGKKGQVIADFMVECTARGKPEEDGTGQERKRELWEVHSDGSCTKDGSGGGAVLTSPEGFKAYHSFKFTFRATNNEAEYEALIGGIQIALFMKIKHIRLKSDSKLAIGQLKGEMEAKEGRLKKYRDCAKTLLGQFESYELIYVPREENEEADMLAKLCRTIPIHMEGMGPRRGLYFLALGVLLRGRIPSRRSPTESSAPERRNPRGSCVSRRLLRRNIGRHPESETPKIRVLEEERAGDRIAVLAKKTEDPLELRVARGKRVRRELIFLLPPHVGEGKIFGNYHHEEAAEPIVKFVDRAIQKLHIGPGREAHEPPAQLAIILVGTEEREEELQSGRYGVAVAKFDQKGMEREAASHPNRVVVDDQSAGDVRIALQSSTRGFLDAIIRRNDSPHLPQLRRSNGGNILVLLGFLAAVEDLGNLGDCLLHAIIKVTWAIGTPGSDWRDMRHHDPRSV